MKRSRITSAALALVGLALLAAPASAEQIKFAGAHPIPDAQEGDFCYIEVPHVHVYTPANPEVLYRSHNGQHHFVGDPVAFGYDGEKHSYYGHHPVQVDPSVHIDVRADPVTEYCYLNGPHFHGYAPPVNVNFELKGGAYWYIGKYPRPYHKRKKRYARINVIYEPIVYVRPEVVVEAPAGYLGPVVDVHVDHVDHVPPGHAHGRGRAGAAVGIDVHIPVPTIEVGIGVGVDRHHHHGKHKKHRKWKKHKKHRHRH
ncbi:hypothetical protein [Haliangium ochraceum]|uniref:YHYH domain-containing protein n=1 Tax=Haliangium ochraceum (strain DSM 14365 / JCM 11303 / SMP-2) TaxID=502025 RepID=D0LYW0_HALO1|nr:hypothetical protein [Haliangium ochraceum]ACY14430.1 conserved hypothetical protein [Haliangium ochraceum DSM 14365]